MSCNRFQLDLSRCLDGRLSGNRRTVVMSHVDECAACATVWEEMQAAQSLTFGLDQHRVSANFRDDVWKRIRSGEGSPDVLLQEPVTTWTKIRYGMIGAAAAAAFLFGLHLLTRAGSPIDASLDSDTGTRTEIAIADNPTPDSLGISNPDLPIPIEAPTPAMPSDITSQLANLTVDKVTTAAKRLQLRSRVILGGHLSDKSLIREVNEDVRTIDGGLFVLDTMQKKSLVELDGNLRDCFVAARNSLSLNPNDSQQKTYDLVRTLGSCSLDGRLKVVTYAAPQIRQPYELFFSLLADDPNFRRIVTELNLVNQPGKVMFFQFADQNGFGSALRLIPGRAPEADEPTPTEPKPTRRLEKRSK